MQTLSSSSASLDADYVTFRAAQTAHFAATATGPLFETDASALWETYMAALGHNQHYNCRACRQFIERYGHLVTIDEQGRQIPVMWPADVSGAFGVVSYALFDVVRKARVTNVFTGVDRVWGIPLNTQQSGPHAGVTWQHMHAVPSVAILRSERGDITFKEDFGMLSRARADYTLEHVQRAHHLLTTGALYRSEKCIGVATWLLDLYTERAETKNTKVRENLLWRRVASAPVGYCHVRTGMIGTLLDDVKADLDTATIKERFDKKMNPLIYQRPQAAPTAGNLAVAEKKVAEMGVASALRRRYAKIEDVREWVWTPFRAERAGASEGSPVFGHLTPKGAAPAKKHDAMGVKQTMTWVKFRDTVLPDAASIEYVVASRSSYCGFVTAADPEAKNIFQWDHPVSWYQYAMGSSASQWGLKAVAKVTGITYMPSMWGTVLEHHGKGVIFLLDGAKDAQNNSAALFPEILRSDFREIRSVIEAHSRSSKIEGEGGEANGLMLNAGQPWSSTFRVTSKLGFVTSITLDRWD